MEVTPSQTALPNESSSSDLEMPKIFTKKIEIMKIFMKMKIFTRTTVFPQIHSGFPQSEGAVAYAENTRNLYLKA